MNSQISRNACNVNPVNPNNTAKKVTTVQDAAKGIAVGLLRIMDNIDVILKTNEYLFHMLDEIRATPKIKKIHCDLKKPNLEALGVTRNMINDLLISTSMASKVKYIENALCAAERHMKESDKALFESEGLLVLDIDLMGSVEKIINSASLSYTELNLPRLEVNPPRGISGKIKVKSLRKKSQRVKADKIRKDTLRKELQYPYHIDGQNAEGQDRRFLHVSFYKVYELPLPEKYTNMYEMNQALEMLKSYYVEKDGFQRLIRSLHKKKMIGYGKQAFTKEMKKYVATGIVLEEGPKQITAKNGRPRLMELDKICKTHNAKVHNNSSMVTDGMQDAEEALTNEILRQAQEAGMSMTDEIVISIRSLANYDFYATVMDENISSVKMANSRLKSWSRRIAARSIRTWATTVCSTILAHYIPGVWENKPTDLTEGAEAAYKLARETYGCPVRPVDSRFVINHDGSGALRTAGRQTSRNKEKEGKISAAALLRDFRKTSSKWIEATKEDSKFKGIGVEMKKINCAAGLSGKDVHLVKNIPAERMSENMIIMEIAGMGACEDMNPDSSNSAFVVFLRGNGRDEFTEETVSAQYAQWYHENVVRPFIEVLRKTDPTFHWEPGAEVPPEYRTVLSYDGEMSYTGYLKKLKVAAEDARMNIIYRKIAGGYTEVAQANDKGKGFMLSKQNDRILTEVDNDDCQMKHLLDHQFKRLNTEKKLILTKNQRESIIDHLCISREVCSLSYSVHNIRTSFVSTGEQSKSRNGKKFYPCPDLNAMTDSNKNEHLKRNREHFHKMLLPTLSKMKVIGHAFDKWMDAQEVDDPQNYLPQDTLEDGVTVVEKKCSDTAYHEQRGMLTNWPGILDNMRRLEQVCKEKVRNANVIHHLKLMSQFKLNEEAEKILRGLADLNADATLETCTEAHFEKAGKGKLNKSHLVAFIWLRITEDLEMVKAPEYNRGTFKAIQEGKKGKFLFQEAYNLRSKSVVAKEPTEPAENEEDHVSSAPPLFIRVGNHINLQNPWNPSAAFVHSAFNCITSLQQQYSDPDREHWKDNLVLLEDDSLRKNLGSRLSNHLKHLNNQNVRHPIWEWVYRNIGMGAAILKLAEMTNKDATLSKSTSEETLLSPRFVANHPMFTDETKHHHGSYLAIDLERMFVIRSGSASVGCAERVYVAHPKGAKLLNLRDAQNQFYSRYPNRLLAKNVIESIRRGWFEDIQFFPGIIFADENKKDVQDLFEWDEHTLAYLNNRLGDKPLEYKKHRAVCYFFETLLELCLDPKHNVSSSLGFESFIIKINSGFNDDYREQDLDVDVLDGDGDVAMIEGVL